MQQMRTRRTARFWLRLLLVLAWMAAAMAVPMTIARACTCMPADHVQAAGAAELAFVGTAIGQRGTNIVDRMTGPMVETAFRVERASASTPEITTVRAGTSGASCGVSFALAEEWLVVLTETDPGGAGGETHLCAGNTRVADIPPGEIPALRDLLDVDPVPAPVEPESGPPPGMLATVAAGLAALVAIGWGARRYLARPGG